MLDAIAGTRRRAVFRKIARWLLVVAACIPLGLGLGLVALDGGLPSAAWMATSLVTLVVFGTAIEQFRTGRRSAAFWVVLLGLFTAHVAVMMLIVSHWRDVSWPPIAVLAALEYAVVSALLTRAGFE